MTIEIYVPEYVLDTFDNRLRRINKDFKVDVTHYGEIPECHITIRKKGDFIAENILIPVPQSCMMYSCGLYVEKKYRRKGIAKTFMDFKIDLAKENGFKFIIAQVNSNNTPELNLLMENGFKFIEHSDTVLAIKKIK